MAVSFNEMHGFYYDFQAVFLLVCFIASQLIKASPFISCKFRPACQWIGLERVYNNVERIAFRLPAPAAYWKCNAAFTVAARTRVLVVLTHSSSSNRSIMTIYPWTSSQELTRLAPPRPLQKHRFHRIDSLWELNSIVELILGKGGGGNPRTR